MRITQVTGREILDSSGFPTLECDIILDKKILVRSSVPSGTSLSSYEAKPLYDGGLRLMGYGVTKAIDKLETIIGPKLIGKEPNMPQMDQLLITMDGTKDKSNLGANTILATSLAVTRAEAIMNDIQLYESIARDCNYDSVIIPFTMFNIINGGMHADNKLSVQEILLVPMGFPTFRAAYEAATTIFDALKKILIDTGKRVCLGMEGGFAPELDDETEALNMLVEAIIRAGYVPREQCWIALDVSATRLYDPKTKLYKMRDKIFDSQALIDHYQELVHNYPIYSIEDGLAESDFDGWKLLTKQLGDQIQIVGDDLFATNPQRIAMGIEEQLANTVIIKPNQIGTVTESIQALALAKNAGWRTIISHRSRETEDTFIVDFAVGTNAGQLKAGGCMSGERIIKYNHLLRLEDALHSMLLSSSGS